MNENNSNSGITFFGLLQVAFIVLKLMNIIKWNWWLVFIPFYISTALIITMFVVMIFIMRK